jgi:peptide/nickel transport system permease protein
LRRYIATRTLSLLPTLLGVTILVFLMLQLVPGTIVDQLIGADASSVPPEARAAARANFGLDRPLPVQYGRWLLGVLHGDLGQSWRSGIPVSRLIIRGLGVTLELAAGALLVALLVGIPLGVLSAVNEGSVLDHAVRVLSLTSLSIPIFWQAAMIILATSLWFHWVPPVNYVPLLRDPVANLTQFAIPMVVLGTVVSAQFMRITRGALLDVLRHDYIRTARAKGLANGPVTFRHGLRNALIPVVTVIGAQVGYLLGGAVVTEQVFTLPGVGRLVLDAVYQRDYPVVQGSVLVIAAIFMLANLAVDLAYGYLDPRIRYR